MNVKFSLLCLLLLATLQVANTPENCGRRTTGEQPEHAAFGSNSDLTRGCEVL